MEDVVALEAKSNRYQFQQISVLFWSVETGAITET